MGETYIFRPVLYDRSLYPTGQSTGTRYNDADNKMILKTPAEILDK